MKNLLTLVAFYDRQPMGGFKRSSQPPTSECCDDRLNPPCAYCALWRDLTGALGIGASAGIIRVVVCVRLAGAREAWRRWNSHCRNERFVKSGDRITRRTQSIITAHRELGMIAGSGANTDLPLSGRMVQLLVIARRFRCDAVLCGRQIFTERFADGILAPSARRTARLDSIVHHLGLALGGRPAAGFAKRLRLPVSKDTLLRVVRRRSRSPADPLKVIGIDDSAWRRNHR
ncbi:hypothetical protein ABIF66_001659 [Bradyrhizobium japonicum]